METYADTLRGLADKLDTDFYGNVKEVVRLLLGMAISLVGEQLVTPQDPAPPPGGE